MSKTNFNKIYPENIQDTFPKFCYKCNLRVNQIIVQSKVLNKKAVQYLKCPKCHTVLSKKIILIIKELDINPLINFQNAKT